MLLGGPFAKSIPTNPASSKTLFTVISDDSIIPKLLEQLKTHWKAQISEQLDSCLHYLFQEFIL